MADADEEAGQGWYDRKSALMEAMLGREHDVVMHAIIPYGIGGPLDLYYYPNGVPGTAVATKELSELPGDGPCNAVFRNYELVMFTKHPIDLDAADDPDTAFGRMHVVTSAVLNRIARYSAQATLNPNETCEFPPDVEIVGGRCLVFDGYPSYAEELPAEFGLLAVIEVFRSEMDYARAHGGRELLKRLKASGHYPYSDLDREPVA